MIAFVLAQSQHGAMIVNRLDYNQSFNGEYYGVGAQIMETGTYDPGEIDILQGTGAVAPAVLRQRRHGARLRRQYRRACGQPSPTP